MEWGGEEDSGVLEDETEGTTGGSGTSQGKGGERGDWVADLARGPAKVTPRRAKAA